MRYLSSHRRAAGIGGKLAATNVSGCIALQTFKGEERLCGRLLQIIGIAIGVRGHLVRLIDVRDFAEHNAEDMLSIID